MDEPTNLQLTEFAKQVRKRVLARNAARGKEAEKLTDELSAFIMERMQVLMASSIC